MNGLFLCKHGGEGGIFLMAVVFEWDVPDMARHAHLLTDRGVASSTYQTIFWQPSHCNVNLTSTLTFTGLQLEQLKEKQKHLKKMFKCKYFLLHA